MIDKGICLPRTDTEERVDPEITLSGQGVVAGCLLSMSHLHMQVNLI